MRITAPLARAAARRAGRDRTWDDDRFRQVRDVDLAQPTTSIRSVLGATVLCLVLALLLTTGKLVEIAARQPLGTERDRWLDLAEGVDRVANFLSLNRPYDLIHDLRGAGDAPGQRVDSIDAVAEAAGLDRATPDDLDPAPPQTTPAPPPSAAPSAGPNDATTTVPTTSATTTTIPPAIRTVSGTEPLTVHVVGDSQAEFLGQALATESGERALEVTVDHQISTSLARPDYFNWPAELADVIAADDPEAIVVFLGANEFQDMVTDQGVQLVRGSEEWRAEWVRRLAIMLDLLEAPHRRVFWVGQPPMRNGRINDGVAIVNELAEPVVTIRSHAEFIDIWDRFGGDGGYRERVIGPEGDEVRARVGDGVHLTRQASSWVADLVLDEMDESWEFVAG